MTDTTYDEARRCPKCDVLGTLTKQQPIRQDGVKRGSQLHTFICKNDRCIWYNEVCRTILVNPDGTIPEPRRHIKRFPALPDRTEAVRAALDRQIQIETQRK